MTHKYYLPNLLLLVLTSSYCGDAPAQNQPEASAASGQSATAGASAPTSAGGSRAQSKSGGAGTSAAGAGTVATSAAGGGKSGAASSGSSGDTGSSGPSGNKAGAGAAGSVAASAAGSGTAPAAGSGGTGAAGAMDMAPQAGSSAAGAGSTMTPDPVDTAYVWGVGLGVSDVPAAVKFYTEVMHMDVEKDSVQREDRVETVLASTKAGRGSRLVLMKYNDNRETTKISAKLVWQAPNPSAINAAAAMYPDYVSRLNIGIVQFDGPSTYIQEVGSSFDDGGAGIMEPYMVALGFATSEQQKTISFWEMAFGMMESPLGTFTVTDATGTGSISEVTLQIPTGGGSALVPQTWTPMRNAKDNPVKVVLFVPDAQASADKVMAAGGTITQPAARSAAYDNRLLIVAKDPDGYLVEIVQ